MIRVLIADDHAMFREGIKSLLEISGGVSVVAEASSGQEAVDRARQTKPDIVLLDISMPGRGGPETVQDLKSLSPPPKVLMLTALPEDQYAVRCLKVGADGYLTKDNAPEELLQAIRRVRQGGKYISPTLAERLAESLSGGGERRPHEKLSNREFEVMLKIASGKTVSEIADELHLSVKTISTYRARILEKTGLKNNAEIMRYAMQEGLTG